MRITSAAFLLFILTLNGCGGETEADSPNAAPPPRPPATVEVARVEEGEVVPRLTLVGAVTPARRTTVGSAVDGRVTKMHVDAGDQVQMVEEDGRHVGQPIAQLLTETISIEIAAAEAELEKLRQRLRELEEGTRPEELSQAQARLQAAEARAEYAQARYQRRKPPNNQSQSVVSDEEFEEALSAALEAQQNLLEARAAFDLADAGPRTEQIEQARAEVARQREEVKRLEDQRRKYTIRAPYRGDVVAKLTEVGAWLTKGDPVAEVIELDPVDVEVEVPESLVALLRLGDTVPVTIDALPEGENTFEGQVYRIIPDADLRARTFPVKIRLQNQETKDGFVLKAGMLARAMLSGVPYRATLVPKDALVLGGRVPIVVLVEQGPDGQSIGQRVEVEKGVAVGELIEVRGDLDVGRQIVVRGNERVQPGQPLMIVKSETDP